MKKQINRCRGQTSGYLWGEGREEGQYRGEGLGGKKGYYGIIWNYVCETFKNYEALQNLKNHSKKVFKS